MMKRFHLSRLHKQFSLREKRLIFEVGGGKERTTDVENDGGQMNQKEKDVSDVQKLLDTKISNTTAQVDELPEQFKKQVHENVSQFCRISYDEIAEKDGEKTMNKEEYTEWYESVMRRTDEVLSGIAGGVEGAKAEQDSKEKKLESLEKELADIDGGIKELDHAELDLVEENLSDPEKLPGELEKYRNRAVVLQEKRVEMAEKMDEVMDIQKVFIDETTRYDWAIGGGAMGGALMLTLIPGVNIAAAGVAAAGVAAAAAVKMVMRAANEKRANKANEAVQEFKESYNEQRKEFAGVVGDMQQDGDALHGAAPHLRQKIEENRDVAKGKLAEGADEASGERSEALQRIEEHRMALLRIQDQKIKIEEQQKSLRMSRKAAEEKGETVDARKHALGDKLSSIDEAISEMESAGVLEGDNEQMKEKYEELLSVRNIMNGGSAQMEKGSGQLKAFLENTADMDPEMDEQRFMLDTSEETLLRTTEMLTLSESALSERIRSIEEASGFIDEVAANKIETVNGLQEEVTKGVSEIAIENITAQAGIEMEWSILKDLKVEQPSFASDLASTIAAPFDKLFSEISYVLELGSDIPVLGHGFSFLSGVSDAAKEITTGVTKMAILLPAALGGNEEGIAMAKGLGNMALFGATEASREVWSDLGNAIVAADMWEKDGAKAAGKAAANLAMFLFPGVGQAGGAGRLAALAGRGAVGRMAARTTGLVRGAGRTYLNMAKGAAKIPGAAGRLLKRPFTTPYSRLLSKGAKLRNARSMATKYLQKKGIRRNLNDLANMSDDALIHEFKLGPNSTAAEINAAIELRNLAQQANAGFAAHLNKVGSLDDATRLEYAKDVLKLDDLSPTQSDAILRAHKVGSKKHSIGNYKQKHINAKARILKEARFTPDQIRLLMEEGIAGSSKAAGKLPKKLGKVMKNARKDFGKVKDIPRKMQVDMPKQLRKFMKGKKDTINIDVLDTEIATAKRFYGKENFKGHPKAKQYVKRLEKLKKQMQKVEKRAAKKSPKKKTKKKKNKVETKKTWGEWYAEWKEKLTTKKSVKKSPKKKKNTAKTKKTWGERYAESKGKQFMRKARVSARMHYRRLFRRTRSAETAASKPRPLHMDEAGRFIDDAGNAVDMATLSDSQLATALRASNKPALELRGTLNSILKNSNKTGILKNRNKAVSNFIEGKTGRIRLAEIDKEISRCRTYVEEFHRKGKANRASSQMLENREYISGLQEFRRRAEAITKSRHRLSKGLKIKRGSPMSYTKNGETFTGRFSVDTSGKIRLTRSPKNGTSIPDYKLISPERLPQFRRAPARNASAAPRSSLWGEIQERFAYTKTLRKDVAKAWKEGTSSPVDRTSVAYRAGQKTSKVIEGTKAYGRDIAKNWKEGVSAPVNTESMAYKAGSFLRQLKNVSLRGYKFMKARRAAKGKFIERNGVKVDVRLVEKEIFKVQPEELQSIISDLDKALVARGGTTGKGTELVNHYLKDLKIFAESRIKGINRNRNTAA